MLDTPSSEVLWRVLATHSIRQFPLHFPSRSSPCAITFHLDCTSMKISKSRSFLSLCSITIVFCNFIGGFYFVCYIFRLNVFLHVKDHEPNTVSFRYNHIWIWHSGTEAQPLWHLDDWLTVHRSITLVDLQLDAQNSYLFTYNTFIKILCMFRALPCSSSGGLRRNCINAASGKGSSSFLTGAQDSHLQRVTMPEAAYIQLRRRPPEDEQGNARNM